MLKKSFAAGLLVVICAVTGSSRVLAGQSAGPQPAPMPPPIAAPRDVPYSGTIRLSIDATDLRHRLFNVREIELLIKEGDPARLDQILVPRK